VLNDNDDDDDNVALEPETEPEVAPIFTKNVSVNICFAALDFIYLYVLYRKSLNTYHCFLVGENNKQGRLVKLSKRICLYSKYSIERVVAATQGSKIDRYLRFPQIPAFDSAGKNQDILDWRRHEGVDFPNLSKMAK
jgi:hypothetical protein